MELSKDKAKLEKWIKVKESGEQMAKEEAKKMEEKLLKKK